MAIDTHSGAASSRRRDFSDFGRNGFFAFHPVDGDARSYGVFLHNDGRHSLHSAAALRDSGRGLLLFPLGWCCFVPVMIYIVFLRAFLARGGLGLASGLPMIWMFLVRRNWPAFEAFFRLRSVRDRTAYMCSEGLWWVPSQDHFRSSRRARLERDAHHAPRGKAHRAFVT